MGHNTCRQTIQPVPALQDGDDPASAKFYRQPGEYSRGGGKSPGRYVEPAEQVALLRVKTRADENEVRAKPGGGGHEAIPQGSEELLIGGADRQRDVHRGSLSVASAGIPGCARAGVGAVMMGAEVKNAPVVVKNILRPVAVMVVPVHDQDAVQTVMPLEVTRRHGDVIEDAESHRAAGGGMMAGRPDGAEGIRHLTLHDPVRGSQDTARGQPRHSQRTGRNDCVSRAQLGETFETSSFPIHQFQVVPLVRQG